MHCPTYFRFKMGTANQAVLLDYQGMEKITKPTAHMEAVLGLPDAEWWPRESEIASMDKYWVEYEYPYENSSESPMFRMALISGETVFFMAKGGNWIVEKDRK